MAKKLKQTFMSEWYIRWNNISNYLLYSYRWLMELMRKQWTKLKRPDSLDVCQHYQIRLRSFQLTEIIFYHCRFFCTFKLKRLRSTMKNVVKDTSIQKYDYFYKGLLQYCHCWLLINNIQLINVCIISKTVENYFY